MKPFLTTATAALLAFSAPAGAIDLSTMSEEEREIFREEVRAYLLDNPEVIMEAVAVLEQRDAQAQVAADVELVQTHSEALFNDGYSWQGGNPDGDVTLVEFVDYRCGYCRRAAPEVEELVETDGNMRVIVKEFPILGEQSMLASRFAIATQIVAGDEAYKSVHDTLIAFPGDITEAALTRIGDGLGLDSAAIVAKMDSDDVTIVIAENHRLGQAMGISGTPSFVMGDQVLRGFLPLDGMRAVAEEVRGG